MKNSEYIEANLKEKVEQKIGLKFKVLPNDWIIEQFEMLLNCYPILRKFNYKIMSLNELQALVERLFNYLEMQYSEGDDLIFVDLTEMKTLMSFKEMMLWILFALLKDKSHVNFIFNKKLLDDTKVSNADVIDYLCDNSYFLKNSAKNECHFTLSVAAILGFDYYQDSIISSLKVIQQYYKKDLSLKEYIDYRKTGQNINIKTKLKMQSSSVKINL
ncbi:MAG: hypothetical protein ACJA2M_001680 [Polaribacter sp.]|jgi:hypothetical protein